MMFLGGVFVPMASLPLWLRVVARFLRLSRAALDLLVLAAFAAAFFVLASQTLASRRA